MFNLSGTEQTDVSPEEEEVTNQREQNILDILDTHGTITSLRQLQTKLQETEGVLSNRDTLKKELKNMVEKEMIVFETGDTNASGPPNSKKIAISLPEQVEQYVEQ